MVQEAIKLEEQAEAIQEDGLQGWQAEQTRTRKEGLYKEAVRCVTK